MYLGGDFGDDPNAVNCYAASAFFAVDRAASYLRKWKTALDDGEIIIMDRYTTSNMVHQTSKLPFDEWDAYLNWLYDFEFCKIGLPVPDKVFYLKVTTEISEQRLNKRYNNDESRKDIHEKDEGYLKSCEKSGVYAAEKFGWQVVECAVGARLRSIDDIHSELLNNTLSLFESEGK